MRIRDCARNCNRPKGRSQNTSHSQVKQWGSGTSLGKNVITIMKKALVLLAIGTLVLGACQKEPQKDTPSKDSELTGEKVDVSGISKDVKKVFVLSEGSMVSGMFVNSSLMVCAFPAIDTTSNMSIVNNFIYSFNLAQNYKIIMNYEL